MHLIQMNSFGQSKNIIVSRHHVYLNEHQENLIFVLLNLMHFAPSVVVFGKGRLILYSTLLELHFYQIVGFFIMGSFNNHVKLLHFIFLQATSLCI